MAGRYATDHGDRRWGWYDGSTASVCPQARCYQSKEERCEHDLGRFGLGLKTASFSQARCLVAATKTSDTGLATRCWDLDYIESSQQWRLLFGDRHLSETELHRLQGIEHGTMIKWERLDRLFSGGASDERQRDEFFTRADQLADYLATIFHRFLAPQGRLRVWINPEVAGAEPIKPWDPFLASLDKTQVLPEEYLAVDGGRVRVRPYILPHQSAFASSEEHRRAGGLKGWNAQQGFYVYRNNRLLVSGSWLNLGIRQEEHYKLARIALDISNELDHAWAIDVRKSQAVPPTSLRRDLRRISERVRRQAKEVYAHRGRIVSGPPRGNLVQVWQAKKKDEKISYHINRRYPLVDELRKQLSDSSKDILSKLLVLIEETVPVGKIYFNAIESPECHKEAFEGGRDTELIRIADTLLELFQTNYGYTREEALDVVMAVEPFNSHLYLREALTGRRRTDER